MRKWLLGKQPDGRWFVFCDEAQSIVAMDIEESTLAQDIKALYKEFLERLVTLETMKTIAKAKAGPDIEWEVAAAATKYGRNGFSELEVDDINEIVNQYKEMVLEEKEEILQEIRNSS